MTTGPACPLCGTAAARTHLRLERFAVVECARCGFQWADPMPTPDELRAFYNDPTYYQGCECGYEDYLAGEAGHRRLARRRLARLRDLVPTGRLLDWGCGPGFFLSEAERAGWRVAGIELADDMRASAASRVDGPVFRTVQEASDAIFGLDAVTFWECIEHLPDPVGAAREAAALLRPGGILALSTPNTAHRIARSRPRAWREYKPPAHVGYFTDRSLVACLERAGFTAVDVRFTTPFLAPEVTARLEPVARRWGTGGDRKTRAWWLYSLAFRAMSLPAFVGCVLRPGAFCAGLEAHARRS